MGHGIFLVFNVGPGIFMGFCWKRLVTEASDHALQGADDAVAHILPELQLRKVIPRNQR